MRYHLWKVKDFNAEYPWLLYSLHHDGHEDQYKVLDVGRTLQDALTWNPNIEYIEIDRQEDEIIIVTSEAEWIMEVLKG